MPAVRATVDAPAEEVFDLLLDPAAFPQWVVGARRIRAVDGGWPEPGTSFHHESGVWPMLIRDRTEMLRAERPRRIELRAYARPSGAADVIIELEPAGARTRVTLHEHPSAGPVRRVWNPLMETALYLRNVESLRRLRALVRRRARESRGG